MPRKRLKLLPPICLGYCRSSRSCRADLRSCTRVRITKKAKINKLAKRIFPSSVSHSSTPIPPYIASASHSFVSRLTHHQVAGAGWNQPGKRNAGAQGWIRTTERRKGGQIYSLLALTAHPPVHVPILRGARLRCHRLRTKTRFQRSASSTLPAEASCGAARVKHATIAGIQDISRRPGRRIHRQVRVDCKNGYALLRQAVRLKHAQKLISLANARVPGKQLGAGEGI